MHRKKIMDWKRGKSVSFIISHQYVQSFKVRKKGDIDVVSSIGEQRAQNKMFVCYLFVWIFHKWDKLPIV